MPKWACRVRPLFTKEGKRRGKRRGHSYEGRPVKQAVDRVRELGYFDKASRVDEQREMRRISLMMIVDTAGRP